MPQPDPRGAAGHAGPRSEPQFPDQHGAGLAQGAAGSTDRFAFPIRCIIPTVRVARGPVGSAGGIARKLPRSVLMSDIKVLDAHGGGPKAVVTFRTQEARMSCESSGRGLARTCRAAEDLSRQASGTGRRAQMTACLARIERYV